MKRSRQGLLASAASIVAVLLCILTVSPAGAGPNETTDLVAMYAHIPVTVPGATGPFSTAFYVANGTSPTAITVNVKCFNDIRQRVGPAAGTNVSIPAFDIDVVTPVSLGLTTDPNFTGLGFCYFARTAGDDFAVTFAMGIQGTNPGGNPSLHPLFSSTASLAIGASTAQAIVSEDDANAPLWLGGNWTTFLVLVGPTATTIGNVRTDIYNISASLLGSQTRSIEARDLELYTLSSFGGSHGMADITRLVASLSKGYMGWVYAFNGVSFEGLLYDLALDKDDVSALTAADRP